MSEALLKIPIVPVLNEEGDILANEMSLKMTRIKVAEGRADEVSIVTPQKAPELLTTFNRAYLDASEAHSKLKYECARAQKKMDEIRASLLIDSIPRILKEKGLTTSADIRQAIIDADPDYQKARERVDIIEAAIELLKGKMKFLENAYTSVKKIMDTGNFNMLGAAQRERLVATLDEGESVEVGGTIGQPKY